MIIVYVVALGIFAMLLSGKLLTDSNNNLLQYFVTPMITVASLFVALIGYSGNINDLFLLMFIVFCLIGDTVMMIKGENLTVSGFIFFAISHILLCLWLSLYIIDWILVPFVFVLPLISGILLYSKLKKGCSGIMSYALPVYILLGNISLTLAITVCAEKFSLYNIIMLVGVTLFYISDVILGINKFWIPLNNALAKIWIPYATGIMLIALSI